MSVEFSNSYICRVISVISLLAYSPLMGMGRPVCSMQLPVFIMYQCYSSTLISLKNLTHRRPFVAVFSKEICPEIQHLLNSASEFIKPPILSNPSAALKLS